MDGGGGGRGAGDEAPILARTILLPGPVGSFSSSEITRPESSFAALLFRSPGGSSMLDKSDLKKVLFLSSPYLQVAHGDVPERHVEFYSIYVQYTNGLLGHQQRYGCTN
jgi:hypothetical protein